MLYGSSESKEPDILSIADTKLLVNGAHELIDLGLLPVVVLGLFCGIRTEEIKKLDWKDIHLEDESPFVTVGTKIAKKQRILNVDIPKNTASWLSLCRKAEGEIIANPYEAYLYRRLHRLLLHVGIIDKDENGTQKTRWGNNVMRHSFGTYHYALHGNPLETVRLLGHKASDDTLFTHYRALAKKTDGKKFFAIKPAANAAKVVE